MKINNRRDHVYIAWSLFIHLKNSGKYRLICSLIISRVINFNFLYFITVLFTKILSCNNKGKTKMAIISIEKATILDAEKLTEIMTRTFDEEAERWLCGQGDVIDYNIQPPGYSSVEMMRYSIEELDSYKVIMDEKIIGEL